MPAGRNTSVFAVLIALGAVLIALGYVVIGCGSTASHETVHARPVASGSARSRANRAARAGAREPVARIGATTITRGLVEHWVAIDTHEQPGAPEPPDYSACMEFLRSPGMSTAPQTTERLRRTCQRHYDELLRTALSWLLHARWLIGEAADDGVKVDQARLKRESAPNGPHGARVQSTLAADGETVQDLRFKLLVDQLSAHIHRKLEHEVPRVTGALIAEYYKRQEKRFAVPERRDLRILRTASDAAGKRARREIERGASFADLVRGTSLAQPISARHGLLRGLGPNNFGEPPLNKAIFSARIDTLVGPVKISLGYYIFEVLRSFAPYQRTPAAVAPEIASELHQQLRDRVLTRFVAAFRTKWTSKTNCLPGYVVKYCKQYRSSAAESREDPDAL